MKHKLPHIKALVRSMPADTRVSHFSNLRAILSSLLLSLTVFSLAAEPATASTKFNILHIHADDHRADGLGAFGHPVLKTPNLDSLVASGLTFSHCYTMGSMSGAVCQPSRTMLLTGKSWLRIPKQGEGNPQSSLPMVMSRAGYETWHCGKGGNEYPVGLKSFDTNILMDDRMPDQRRGSSERHADAAIKFLRDRKTNAPFYIYLAPPVPHDPRVAAPEFHHMYAPADVPLPPAFMPLHPFDNGEMTVRDEKLAPWPRTPEDTKRQLADYYACITGLDHHVGRIFTELKKLGQWETTIIIFTGDNGLSLGEHGLFGKQNLYEYGGMHVPFVIAGPGIRQGTSNALVYLMDLFPTLAEFGGAQLPENVEGRSLVPIIKGQQPKVRDLLYTGYKNCQRSVRDEHWKLIRYPKVNVTQLFDLQNDPHEMKNLADQPEHAAKVAEMTEKLQAEMKRNGDEIALVVPKPAPANWTPATAKSGPRKTKKNSR